MDWLLQHPQILIAIAIAVVGILQRIKRAAGGPEAAAPAAPSVEPDVEERTRQIQEEIRRRILARRAAAAPEPAEPTPAPPPVMAAPPVLLAPVPSAPAPALTPAPVAAIAMPEFGLPFWNEPRRSWDAAVIPALAAELRHPAGLRRAIALREVLGPPVALR